MDSGNSPLESGMSYCDEVKARRKAKNAKRLGNLSGRPSAEDADKKLPKKAPVDRVPRYVVVHTMGTIKRETALHGDLTAPDLLNWDAVASDQEGHSESPSTKNARSRSNKLPMISSPRGRHHASPKRSPRGVRDPWPPTLPVPSSLNASLGSNLAPSIHQQAVPSPSDASFASIPRSIAQDRNEPPGEEDLV